MNFKNDNKTRDMTCENEIDQFAVGNNIAKLTYPVGLLQSEEVQNINIFSLMGTEVEYWNLSSGSFSSNSSFVRIVEANGSVMFTKGVDSIYGVRPTLSLREGTVISSGTGSESDPFVIQG